MLKNFFLRSSNNITYSSYLWNTIGGLINAGQSFYFSILISRVSGLYWAGVFSIIYSLAILSLSIGNYSMRNYQVTDFKEMFSFFEYKKSREITCFFMVMFCALFIVYKFLSTGYSLDKVMLLIIMCIIKIIDSYEDVFQGFYQKNGRLDLAGKQTTIRLIGSLIGFTVVYLITQDVLLSFLFMFLISLILFSYINRLIMIQFEIKNESYHLSNVWKLLKKCLPLFIGSFLILYICNTPKFSIDSLLNDEIQGYYSFLSMPIFFVGLLNNFIYQPILLQLSECWNKCLKVLLLKKVILQTCIIVGITSVIVLCSYLFGIPILNFIYAVDLNEYQFDLVLLMTGGGFLALSGFYTVILTIMRKQNEIMYIYIIVSIVGLLSSNYTIGRYMIRGASLIYLSLMILLTFLFASTIILNVFKPTQNDN